MSYYQFNRQKILQKAKEKGAEYYLQNKEAIKEKARDRCRNLSEEEKDKIKEYQKKKHQELIQFKKEALTRSLSWLYGVSNYLFERRLPLLETAL